MEIFGSLLHGFLPFSPASLFKSCSFLYGLKDLFTLAQFSRQSCPWLLRLMMSLAVEGTWILTGGYRRFMGKWVNNQSLPTWFLFWEPFILFIVLCLDWVLVHVSHLEGDPQDWKKLFATLIGPLWFFICHVVLLGLVMMGVVMMMMMMGVTMHK